MNQQLGKYIVAAGIIIAIISIVVYFVSGKLQWLGKLPGDIRIEKENFKFYFPITTLIIFSILLNIIIRLFKNFF